MPVTVWLRVHLKFEIKSDKKWPFCNSNNFSIAGEKPKPLQGKLSWYRSLSPPLFGMRAETAQSIFWHRMLKRLKRRSRAVARETVMSRYVVLHGMYDSTYFSQVIGRVLLYSVLEYGRTVPLPYVPYVTHFSSNFEFEIWRRKQKTKLTKKLLQCFYVVCLVGDDDTVE